MNPFFGVMGGGGRPNMMQQVQQFMQQMKGCLLYTSRCV